MRTARCLALLLLVAGCAGRAAAPAPAAGAALPAGATALDATTGAVLDPAALARRAAAADVVLLGELHDNPAHHAARAAILATLAPRRPAVVFEQFPAGPAALAGPAAGEALESWLDRAGFDRAAWRWPLHRPVVEAALAHGRALRGSGVSREELRAVVREGAGAAPEPFRTLLDRAPLDSATAARIDREIVDGHCGALPASMVPGMRAAQVVRDAAMTRALLDAAAGGPAVLIAGNGHVRRDVGVPRLLARLAPDRRMLVVGLLEAAPGGGAPPPAARAPYDVVIVTPGAERGDPCAAFRGSRPGPA